MPLCALFSDWEGHGGDEQPPDQLQSPQSPPSLSVNQLWQSLGLQEMPLPLVKYLLAGAHCRVGGCPVPILHFYRFLGIH